MTPAEINAFRAVLPIYAQRYADIMVHVGGEKNLSPFTIFALGDRESLWGTHKLYRLNTGDWVPRMRSDVIITRAPGMYRIADKARTDAFKLPPNGPGYRYVEPADGLGWGRGLMQIDYEAQYAWVRNHDWRDPYLNVGMGAGYLVELLGIFSSKVRIPPHSDGNLVNISSDYARLRGQEGRSGLMTDPRPLEGRDLTLAAIAAYNTGPGNVIRNLALSLPADASTMKGNYGADVVARLEAMEKKFNAALNDGDKLA